MVLEAPDAEARGRARDGAVDDQRFERLRRHGRQQVAVAVVARRDREAPEGRRAERRGIVLGGGWWVVLVVVAPLDDLAQDGLRDLCEEVRLAGEVKAG